MIPTTEQLEEISRLNEGSLGILGAAGTLPFSALLLSLVTRQRTLVVEVRRKQMAKRIVLEHGVPVDCRSNLVHETLGRFMVAEGKLPADSLHGYLSESASRGLPLGEVLLDHDVVTAEELFRLLQQNLAKKLLDIFTWRDGDFRTLPEVPPPQSPLKIRVPQLVVTGISKFAPQEEVDAGVVPLVGKKLCLHPKPPFALEDIRLSQRQSQVVVALRSGWRIDELALGTGLPFEEITRLLYALALLGVVITADHPAAKGVLRTARHGATLPRPGVQEPSAAAPEAGATPAAAAEPAEAAAPSGAAAEAAAPGGAAREAAAGPAAGAAAEATAGVAAGAAADGAAGAAADDAPGAAAGGTVVAAGGAAGVAADDASRAAAGEAAEATAGSEASKATAATAQRAMTAAPATGGAAAPGATSTTAPAAVPAHSPPPAEGAATSGAAVAAAVPDLAGASGAPAVAAALAPPVTARSVRSESTATRPMPTMPPGAPPAAATADGPAAAAAHAGGTVHGTAPMAAAPASLGAAGTDPVQQPPVRRRNEVMQAYLSYRRLDAFELLGADEDSSPAAIEVGWLEFARRFAPWTMSGPELAGMEEKARDLFLAGARAYAELLDLEQRNALLFRRKARREGRDRRAPADMLAIKTDLLDPEVQYRKGRSLMDVSRFQEAAVLIEFASDCDPQNGLYSAELAYCRFCVAPSQGARALKELQETLRRDPECGLAVFYTGEINRQMGNRDEAETMLRRAIKMMAPDRRPIEALKLLAAEKRH